MSALSTLGLGLLIVVALLLAGVMLHGGWRTLHDELVRRNYRSNPPGPGGLALTLLGLLLPVLLITLFLLLLAVRLFGLLLTQFGLPGA